MKVWILPAVTIATLWQLGHSNKRVRHRKSRGATVLVHHLQVRPTRFDLVPARVLHQVLVALAVFRHRVKVRIKHVLALLDKHIGPLAINVCTLPGILQVLVS